MTKKEKVPVKNLNYVQKLDLLKKVHRNSHPETKNDLEKWGDDLARLQMEEDWLKHPNTAALRDSLSDQLQRIVSVLSTDAKLESAERGMYFKMKDIILELLAVVSYDPVSEMRAIERQIDEEL